MQLYILLITLTTIIPQVTDRDVTLELCLSLPSIVTTPAAALQLKRIICNPYYSDKRILMASFKFRIEIYMSVVGQLGKN